MSVLTICYRELVSWTDRNLAVLALTLSVLLALGLLGAVLVPALWWSALALPALVLLCWPFAHARTGWRLLAALTLTGALTNAHLYWLSSWQLSSQAEESVHVIDVVIDDVPVASEFGWRFTAQLQHWQGRPLPWWQSVRLLLHCYQPACQPKAGERWRYQVKLKRPHASVNFHGFDYERYLFAHHIRALGSVRASALNQKLAPAPGFAIDRWREQLQTKIKTANLSHGALISGLTLGLDDDISRADWHTLRRTGTVHLIAISGLHIVLVAALAGLLAGWLWRFSARACLRLPAQKFAVLVGSVAALAYGALSGFSLPTVRAIVMASVLAFMYWRARKVEPLALLALVALLLIWCDPCALLVVGFWLSFASVAVLLLLAKARTFEQFGADQLSPDQRSFDRHGWWQDALHTQVWLSLALVPLSLWFFGQFSFVSPLANLLAVPFLGALLTPLALLAVLLLPLAPTPALWLLQLVDAGCALFMAAMRILADWPYASLSLPAHTPAEFLLLAATLLALLGRRFRISAALCAGLTLASYGTTWWPSVEKAEVALTVLDVGQGLALSVETADGVLVFDTGPRSARFDAGSDVLATHLLAQGLSAVDTAFVSHGDLDHAGGAPGLAAAMPVAHWRVGEPVDGVPALPCRAGQSWQRGPVRAQVLWPLPEAEMTAPATAPRQTKTARIKANDRSCVLMLHIHGTRILLPGDIERSAELALLRQYGAELRADILLSPHHGSMTSSSPEFLAAVAPSQIIVSAGYRHRHGHPKPAVLARYQAMGAAVFNTADYGAVRLLWPSAAQEPVWQFARTQQSRWRMPAPAVVK